MGMAATTAAAAAGVESQFHVLAVDDSLIDRKLIERLLKTSSYQVTTVDSGSKALEFLGFEKEDEQGGCCNMNYPYVSSNSCSSHQKLVSLSPTRKEVEVNLIITDYCMPGMTGYDLLKKIKESSYFRNIPVVIMSSENVPSRINRCLEEGAEEFFLKPVRLSDVSKLKSHMLKAKCGEDYYQDQQSNHGKESQQKQDQQSNHGKESQQKQDQQSNHGKESQQKQPDPQQSHMQKPESDQIAQETTSQAHEMHVLIQQSQQHLQQQPPTTTGNNKRASSSSSSMDEELSPDNRKRPRYSGLSVA